MKSTAIKFGLFLSTAICGLTATAQEKGLTVGSRIGIGESYISANSSNNSDSKLALGVGATSNYQFTEYFGVVTDVMFISKGGKTDGVTTRSSILGSRDYKYEDTYRLFYAEIPMMAKLSLKLTDNLYVKGFAGPSVNFKLVALETREYEDSDFDDDNGYFNNSMDDLNTVEFGFVYGAGVDIVRDSGSIVFVDFRINGPLSEAGEINGTGVENNYFMISTGYFF